MIDTEQYLPPNIPDFFVYLSILVENQADMTMPELPVDLLSAFHRWFALALPAN